MGGNFTLNYITAVDAARSVNDRSGIVTWTVDADLVLVYVEAWAGALQFTNA